MCASCLVYIDIYMRGSENPHEGKTHKCDNKSDSAGAAHFLQFFIWSALRKKAEALRKLLRKLMPSHSVWSAMRKKAEGLRKISRKQFLCSCSACITEESGRFAEDKAEAKQLVMTFSAMIYWESRAS